MACNNYYVLRSLDILKFVGILLFLIPVNVKAQDTILLYKGEVPNTRTGTGVTQTAVW